MTNGPAHSPVTTSARVGRSTGGAVSILLAVLVAIWLGHQSLVANVQHACREGQWPGFAACAPATQGADTPATVAAAASSGWADAQARLQKNPGDVWALLQLLHRAGPLGRDDEALLAAAAQLAPHRREVLERQLGQALTQQDWSRAVPQLVVLARQHSDAEATRTLARLLALAPQDPRLLAALTNALQPDSSWLDGAVRAMSSSQLPVGNAMPVVSALALAGRLTPATGLWVIGRLKQEGRWLDAHALWLQLWQRPLGLLFNGDFEQAFVSGAFDWEVPEPGNSRVGVQVERVGRGERGQVLQLRFTGRALPPALVRQDVLLPEGHYRLQGDYQSTELRSEAGLAWVLSCSTGEELGRSPPLRTTGRLWSTLGLTFRVPPRCPGATLTLRTQAPYEERTGLRGDMLIDRMRLSRLDPTTGVRQP